MEEEEFLKVNTEIIAGLKDVSELFDQEVPYLVSGSATLLSYSKDFYLREMHDIDVVADITSFKTIRQRFEEKGYETKEFKDVGALPLRIAKNFSTNGYLRFTKGKCIVDVVGASFNSDGSIDVEYLPGVSLHISQRAAHRKEMMLGGVTFFTTPIESLCCLNQFYTNTIGRVTGTKKTHRKRDWDVVQELSDLDTVEEMLQSSYVSILGARIPLSLVQTSRK